MMDPKRKEANRLRMQQQADDIRQLMKYYEVGYTEAQKRFFQLKQSGVDALEKVLLEAKSGGQAPPEVINGCPLCGSVMELKRGPFSQFWGCSRFPKCRGTRNIKVEEKPVVETEMAKVKQDLDLAMDYIQKVGGIEKAQKYISIARKMLEE